jgi:GTP pyrophosphokinase
MARVGPPKETMHDICSGPERWARLAQAAAYAMSVHADQQRKGANTPYIAHLLAVASLVLEHGGDEDQAIAGLLHDAIEDCGIAQEAIIAERFGPRVARTVRACTDADTLPKPPWRERKRAYLQHLETADQDALLVSCCDKLHNARAIVTDLRTDGDSVFERFRAGKAGTLWYYEALAEAFLRLLPGPLSRDLKDAVAQMQQAKPLA